MLYTIDQDMDGNIIYDTWSYLGVYMTQESELEGAILCREDNGDRGCDVYMDDTAEWTVTGDSLVRDFYTGGAEIKDRDDNIVSVVGADGTVYADGDSPYTITVTGVYGTDDLTAFENVPGIGTVADGEYTFDTSGDNYVDLSYIPTGTWTAPSMPMPPGRVPIPLLYLRRPLRPKRLPPLLRNPLRRRPMPKFLRLHGIHSRRGVP